MCKGGVRKMVTLSGTGIQDEGCVMCKGGDDGKMVTLPGTGIQDEGCVMCKSEENGYITWYRYTR